MSEERVRVSLLFADEGEFHHETVTIPAEAVERWDRLIDCLREEPAVLARVYVDVERLVSAQVVDADHEDDED